MSRLPRSTPADEGLDPAAVLALLDALEGFELHSLMVLRRGRVLVEGWWAPYTPERPQLLYSLSKTFTATAAGLAQAEGLLDLDDTLLSHFPALDDEVVDPRSRATTVRHVASMASGHARELLDEAAAVDPDDLVRGLLLLPPEREPGSVFAYSQPCTYALGAVVQTRSGQRLTDYLRPRLLDPLGIGPVGWLTWAGGLEQGWSGLFARTEDVAKLGQLLLSRGRWGDRQLLPAAWVDTVAARHVATPDDLPPDWRRGYGLQVWQSQHGYRGDGAFGQFCLVLPEQEAVVVTTACTNDMQEVLDAVWTRLLPGFDAAAPDSAAQDSAAQARLDERLAGLRLPAAGGAALPDAAAGAYDLAPGGSPCTSLVLSSTDDGWEVRLHQGDDAIAFPVARGEWAVSEPRDGRGDRVPVAASGGAREDGTLHLEVVLLETPHRLDLDLDPRSRTGTAAWRIAPLGDQRFASLHCPRPDERRPDERLDSSPAAPLGTPSA